MKKIVWLLRCGIVLFGTLLVVETLQTSKTNPTSRSATVKKTVKPGDNWTQTTLRGYNPAKVEAARVWLTVKGPQAIINNRPLHVRTMVAGQRVKPDSPKSAVYPQTMTQIYSTDPTESDNSVTYMKNADETVTITHSIPVDWQRSRNSVHDEDVVALDTKNMLKPQMTFPVSSDQSIDVLKVVRLIG